MYSFDVNMCACLQSCVPQRILKKPPHTDAGKSMLYTHIIVYYTYDFTTRYNFVMKLCACAHSSVPRRILKKPQHTGSKGITIMIYIICTVLM